MGYKFKKGDRVVCIKIVPNSSTPIGLIGKKGTVMDDDESYPDVLFDGIKGIATDYSCTEDCFTMIKSELELLTTKS